MHIDTDKTRHCEKIDRYSRADTCINPLQQFGTAASSIQHTPTHFLEFTTKLNLVMTKRPRDNKKVMPIVFRST